MYGKESEDFQAVSGFDFPWAAAWSLRGQRTLRSQRSPTLGLPTLGLWTSGIRGALGSLAESDTMNDHEGGPADE